MHELDGGGPTCSALGSVSRLGQEPGDLRAQGKQVVLDDIPDDVERNTKLVVDEVAPEGVGPRNGVRPDAVDGLEDVPKIQAIVLHSGVASARTRSRMNGLRPSSVTASTRRPRAASASSQKAMKSE